MDSKVAAVNAAVEQGWRVFTRGKRTVALTAEGAVMYLGGREETASLVWSPMREHVAAPVS